MLHDHVEQLELVRERLFSDETTTTEPATKPVKAKAETKPKAKKPAAKVKAAPKAKKATPAKAVKTAPKKKAETTETVTEAPVEVVEAPKQAEKPAKKPKAKQRSVNGGKGKPNANPQTGFGRLVHTDSRNVGTVRFQLVRPHVVRTSMNGSFISVMLGVEGGFVFIRLYGRNLDDVVRRRNPFVNAKARIDLERFEFGYERIVITGELTDERETFGLSVHRGKPEKADPGRTFLMGVPFTGGHVEGHELSTSRSKRS